MLRKSSINFSVISCVVFILVGCSNSENSYESAGPGMLPNYNLNDDITTSRDAFNPSKRFQVVDFYAPESDTVLVGYSESLGALSERNYYSLIRYEAAYLSQYRPYGYCLPVLIEQARNNIRLGKKLTAYKCDISAIKTNTLEEKTIFISRIIGLPGETIELKGSKTFIDNELIMSPEFDLLFNYTANLSNTPLPSIWGDKSNKYFKYSKKPSVASSLTMLTLPSKIYEEITLPDTINNNLVIFGLTKMKYQDYFNIAGDIFPHSPKFGWTTDDFGPLWIPEKGSTVSLNDSTLLLYGDYIRKFENNDVTVNDNKFYINGDLADSYTFKQDYYFILSDNRHNSTDSRYFGFVPRDHIIGAEVK